MLSGIDVCFIKLSKNFLYNINLKGDMKKSQSLVISFVAIIVILILFIQLFLSEYLESLKEDDNLELVEEDATRIGNLLSGPSNPREWESIEEVKKIGLVKEGVILNDTLYEYAKLSYSKSKMLLGIQHDYIFYLLNKSDTVTAGGKEYWGWNPAGGNGGSNLEAVLSDIYAASAYIAKDERFVRFKAVNSSAATLKLIVLVWSS